MKRLLVLVMLLLVLLLWTLSLRLLLLEQGIQKGRILREQIFNRRRPVHIINTGTTSSTVATIQSRKQTLTFQSTHTRAKIKIKIPPKQ